MNNKLLIIPDTQNYLITDEKALDTLAQSIIATCIKENIKIVIHLGDIVNDGGNDLNQVAVARQFIKSLEQAGLLYFAVPGNRDYDQPLTKIKNCHTSIGTSRDLSIFNNELVSHLSFNRVDNLKQYQPDYYENIYFEYEGWGYLLLEFAPRKEVVSWAQNILSRFSETDSIIFITHNYLDNNSRHSDRESKNSSHAYWMSQHDFDGKALWQKLIRPESKIKFTFSGHYTGGTTGEKIDFHQNGSPVIQIFRNYQIETNGGEGSYLIVSLNNNPIELAVETKKAQNLTVESTDCFSYPF